MKNQPALHGRDHLPGGSDPVPFPPVEGPPFIFLADLQLGDPGGLEAASPWEVVPFFSTSAWQPIPGYLPDPIFAWDDETYELTVNMPGTGFLTVEGQIVWIEQPGFYPDPDSFNKGSVLFMTAGESGQPVWGVTGSTNPAPTQNCFALAGSGVFRTWDMFAFVTDGSSVKLQLKYYHDADDPPRAWCRMRASYTLLDYEGYGTGFEQPIGDPF